MTTSPRSSAPRTGAIRIEAKTLEQALVKAAGALGIEGHRGL